MRRLTAWRLAMWTIIRTSSPGQKNVTAGQNVTLQCRAQYDPTAVKWSRADLEPKYILLYRDDLFLPDDQHPSFKNRVDLLDRQMKHRDVSLILKDVTSNDTGRYECRIFIKGVVMDGHPICTVNLRVVPPGQKNVTAGQNVTLQCRAQYDPTAVTWSRADLEPKYILLYRDDLFLPDDQHPSFKNRVDLLDRQMKHRDVSLILKDVTSNDTGRYECRIFIKGVVMDGHPICTVNLRVVPPGQPGGTTEDGGKEEGSVGLIVGLSVFGLFVAVLVGILIYKQLSQTSYEPPAEQQQNKA